ncbi:putative AAA family ATPase [Cucurbitaria berberidis CBS 394.84]|uniref:AAA family ATPase n=1 Tax=Cucurbitaria berberidis CBS 394.84 TaxID=1168544 RepID=A0A9P4GD17_9PLEO|nr:putative AAA family ATPase [Cucurbitaria berberidis CBS 394.84]KAF1843101.1 putative AAA family ATPase [Cucurbitaria berberidis CBS 394.84]
MSAMPAQQSNNLAPPGTLSSIHRVYEDPFRPNKWTTTSPERAGPIVEDAETAQHALVARYTLSDNPAKELDLHSIVVQSPSLKKVLARVLDGYPGITLELDRLEFNAPFECFIHRWEKLMAVREELTIVGECNQFVDAENHGMMVSHLEMLHSTLSTELASTLRTKHDLLKNGVITPLHVWMIFEPGCLLYTKNDGHDRVYKLQSAKWETQNKRKLYRLDCEFVDYDGVGFGMNKETLNVTAWKGTKKITKLEAFPYRFHDDLDILQTRLTERGRKFEAYKGFHFVAYKGVAIGKASRGEAKFDVNSRIVIDSAASMRYNTKIPLDYFETDSFADAPHLTGSDEDTDEDCVVLGETDSTIRTESGKRPSPNGTTKSVLTTEQLLLTDAKLRGYSLRDKKWMSFYIDNVQDIKWQDDAFDSLVAPQEQKDLILAFSESQAKNRTSFDDFIQGKGKGIILLLSGPPGVGKTLTAESVAECMKVPLYSIGAAELGSKPNVLEKKLEDILVMCAKWNAVLLLDEADVFMEARSTQDLDRNKLVAIFLRLLEYFEGLMFLTTNRLEHMDAAFESRIHLTLNYAELDKPSRRQVWSKFLTRSSQAAHMDSFAEADVDRLAKVQLNGRQIKNVIKTAQLLAARYDECLGMTHLDTVLKLRKANEKKVGFFGGE